MNLFYFLCAIGFHMMAFGLYWSQLKKSDSSPPIITWILAAGLSTLNFFSYKDLAGNWWAGGFATISMIGCWGSLFLCIQQKPKKGSGDWSMDIGHCKVIVLTVIALSVWKFFASARYANFIGLAASTIALQPLYRGLRINPKIEKPTPWILWCFAFSFLTLFTVTGPEWTLENNWDQLGFPLVFFVLDGTVVYLATRKPKEAGELARHPASKV